MPSKFDKPGGVTRTIFLDISTKHLSPETIDLLDSQEPSGWPCRGARDAYGYFIYAHDENGGEPPIPDDLWACMEYARNHDCDWLRFDVEDDPYTDLPVLSD